MRPSSLLHSLPLLLVTFLAATTVTANAQGYPGPVAASTPPPPPPLSPPPAAASLPPGAAWSPVADVNDRTIQQVARFAVHAYYFGTGVELELVSVVSGQTHPYDGGVCYQLVITAAGPGDEAGYGVYVWGILGTMTWQLWSFDAKY